jgi:hypothetical protein
VEFRLDHAKFESLCAAFQYILREHAPVEHPVYPGKPAFIFRGECGRYETTTPSIARLNGLSRTDALTLAKISDWVATRLHEEREGLTPPRAFAHLQHYGMPSRIVDFTGDLGQAFVFAGMDGSDVGRLAVLPYVHSEAGPMFEFFDHPWAERAQRQAAYGILMDLVQITDLKADAVRNRFSMRWYEFKILPQERVFRQQRGSLLLQESNDASGGFVRYYVTRYVEEFRKLSPTLTDWILKHIVIAPYCALVSSHEGEEAVIFFRDAECLLIENKLAFDRALEIECSRRYWSEAFNDDSRERLQGLVMPPPIGQVFIDPRTYDGGDALSHKG